MSEAEVGRLRTENAELRRLLVKHQWGGLTPIKSNGACPDAPVRNPLMAVVIGRAALWPQRWPPHQTRSR